MKKFWTVKKIVIFTCVAVITLIAALLVRSLPSSTIIITSNDANSTITLTKQGDTGYKQEAKKNLSVTATPGQYVATVQGNSQAAIKNINLHPFQTVQVSINPPETSGVEPVLTRDAANVAAANDHLVYLDVTSQNIYKIDNHNVSQPINRSIQFASLQWADSNYGLGQAGNGTLYVIDHGNIRIYNPPISKGAQTSYAVAPNHQLYISTNSAVYSGVEGSGLKKLYDAASGSPRLVASNNSVGVFDTGSDKKSGEVNFVILDSAGSVLGKKEMDIYAASWSPDGKKLAIVSDNGSGIFDLKLNKIQSLSNLSTSPVWLSNTNLLYGFNDQVWSYQLDTQLSNQMANMPLGLAINQLALSDDRSYLYVVAQDDNSNFSIKRIGLQGQKVPDVVYQLQDLLPKTLDAYSLSLVNFTHPTVIAQANPDSPPTDFRQAAINELRQDGIDLNKVQLQFSN